MGYDASWNIVGIPRNAKDAAREAARAAGVSVGEWLTRQILTNLSDNDNIREGELPRLHIADRLAELGQRLQELEEHADTEQLREAVKQLHQGLARLSNELVQTAGQSAIQLSGFAAKLDDFVGALDELKGHIGERAEQLGRQFSDFSDQTSARHNFLAGELENHAGKIEGVRNASLDMARALEARVEQASDTARGRIEDARSASADAARALEARVEQMTDTVRAKVDDVRSSSADTARALEARIEQAVNSAAAGIEDVRSASLDAARTLEVRIAQLVNTATVSENGRTAELERLVERLSDFRREALGRAAALEGELSRLAVKAAAGDGSLEEKLLLLERALESSRSETGDLSLKFEQRLSGLVELSSNQNVTSKERLDRLAVQLTETRSDLSLTAEALQRDLLGTRESIEGQSSRHDEALEKITFEIDRAGSDLEELRDETKLALRTVEQSFVPMRHELSGLAAKLEDAVKTDALSTAQLNGTISTLQSEAVVRSAQLDVRISELMARSNSLESRSADDVDRLTKSVTSLKGEAFGRIDELDKTVAVIAKGIEDQTLDLKSQLQTVNAGLSDVNAAMTVSASDMDRRIAHLVEFSAAQAQVISRKFDDVNEAVDNAKDVSLKVSGALENKISKLMNNVQHLEDCAGDNASALARVSKDNELLDDRISDLQTALENLAERTHEDTHELAQRAAKKNDALEQNISALCRAVETLENRSSESSSTLADAIGHNAAFEAGLSGVKTGLKSLEGQLNQTSASHVGLEQQLARLLNSVDELEGRVNDDSGTLARHANSHDALEEKIGDIRSHLERVEDRIQGHSANVSQTLEGLTKEFSHNRAETEGSLKTFDQFIGQLAANSSQQMGALSARPAALGEARDASSAGSSGAVEQQLATMRRDLKDLADKHAEAAALLDQNQAQDVVTAVSLTTLEGTLTKLQTRLSDQALDERFAKLERSILERFSLQARTEPLGRVERLEPVAAPEPPPFAVMVSEQPTNQPASEEPSEDHAAMSALPEVSEPIPAEQNVHDGALGHHETLAQPADHTDPSVQFDQKEDQPATISYISAARQAANDAERARAEVITTPRLDLSKPVWKVTAGLAAAVGLIAVCALAASLYLGSARTHVSSHEVSLTRKGIGRMHRVAAVAHSSSHLARVAVASAQPARSLGVAAKAGPHTTAAASIDDLGLDRIESLARNGDARAELILAIHYLDNTTNTANSAEGIRWLGLSAAQGEALAQFRLATLYATGHGVSTDMAKAMQWYKAAAVQGNRKAMYNLAVAYAQGNGVKKDLPEAARWFAKAAGMGLIDAQFDLAVLYERGEGVPLSLLDAYRWYAIAASNGDKESKDRIDALKTQLAPADKAAAETAAAQFKPSAMDERANLLVRQN